jgi:hypothetical protein
MKILFTNKATFNRDGMNITQKSHVWSLSNPHEFMRTHFQSCVLVNILCVVTGSQVMRPFVLENCLKCDCYFCFLEDDLLLLLDVPHHMR